MKLIYNRIIGGGKIMILGGGQAQIELIKTAKSMGLYTIVVGVAGDYPGYKIADKCYFVNIFNKEDVLRIAKEEQIDGISMVCSDFGLETIGYVNDALGLSGVSEKAAKCSSNKYSMKHQLKANGINTADFRIVHDDEEVEVACKELKFPLIVKAVDLQGSRGIYICKTPSDVLCNYRKSISESRQDYCIVEEFIQGNEFGAQAFVYHGEVLFVQAHGDIVWNSGKTNIPVGHYMPYTKDEIFNATVNDLVCRAIKAMDFDNCAVNVDLILKDNIPYIIEMTGRAGANFLPELTSTYLGMNYYEMVLKTALGESAKKYFNQRLSGKPCVLTRQLFSDKDGLVEEIGYENMPNIRKIVFFVEKGDKVKKFTDSRDCIGKVLCVGDTLEQCKSDVNEFLKKKFKFILV